MPAPTADPDRTSNAQAAASGERALVNVKLPATVVSYNQANQTATVQIVPCFRRRDPADGNQIRCYRPPLIPNVPVWFEGSGPFSQTHPLAVGDTGMLEICDRSIDEWKATAATKTEPENPRRHDLTDGVFVPGVRSPADPLPASAFVPNGMAITGPKVVINSADTRLGSDAATDPVTLESLVAAEISTLATTISTAMPPTAAGIQAAVAALILTGWPGAMGATKVVAE